MKGLVTEAKHVARIGNNNIFQYRYTLIKGRVCPELNYLSGEYTNRSNPPVQAATLVTTDTKADKYPPATFTSGIRRGTVKSDSQKSKKPRLFHHNCA